VVGVLSLGLFLGEALGLHHVVLSTLLLSEHSVPDALLRGVGLGDVVDGMVVFTVMSGGLVVLLTLSVLRNEVRADIVEVVHLLALVVLEETLVGAQMLLVLCVEAVGDPVDRLVVKLLEDILAVAISEVVNVVTAAFGESQQSN